MGFSFFEVIVLTTCFFLSIAAVLTIFRTQRTYLSLEDHNMLKAMIRMEVTAQKADSIQPQSPYQAQTSAQPESVVFK